MLTLTAAILQHIVMLIITGMALGTGFMIVRMIEEWVQGKRLMANKELMAALGKL